MRLVWRMLAWRSIAHVCGEHMVQVPVWGGHVLGIWCAHVLMCSRDLHGCLPIWLLLVLLTCYFASHPSFPLPGCLYWPIYVDVGWPVVIAMALRFVSCHRVVSCMAAWCVMWQLGCGQAAPAALPCVQSMLTGRNLESA